MDLPPPDVGAILVVDDERDIRDSIADLLRASIPAAKVLTASDGVKALELLKTERVDAILSDFRMPQMDGITFLAKARAISPDAARILITAYPELDLAMRAINEAQIQNFLTKPVQPVQLLQAVNAAILKTRNERRQRQFKT